MEEYKIKVDDSVTILELPSTGFKMRVVKDDGKGLERKTAMLEATLYIEKKSFIPYCRYLFELLDGNGMAIDYCNDINLFKTSVDFYFNTVLNTDLYVKSIPKESALYPSELENPTLNRGIN